MVKGNDGVTVHRLVTSDLTGQNGLWRLADAWQYHPIVDKDNQPSRTGQIRKSRLGVLLVPDVDYDGDLLGVRLPRHPVATMSEARGYGCQNGAATLIQGVTVSTEGHR